VSTKSFAAVALAVESRGRTAMGDRYNVVQRFGIGEVGCEIVVR